MASNQTNEATCCQSTSGATTVIRWFRIDDTAERQVSRLAVLDDIRCETSPKTPLDKAMERITSAETSLSRIKAFGRRALCGTTYEPRAVAEATSQEVSL